MKPRLFLIQIRDQDRERSAEREPAADEEISAVEVTPRVWRGRPKP